MKFTKRTLIDMKKKMAQRGNWKEIERLNKIMSFQNFSKRVRIDDIVSQAKAVV